MSLTAGARLGPYVIIRKIGAGGMGEVYEALHEAIERHVAIKILHPELALEPAIASRFVQEARAVNRIDHPGVVQISDYSQHSDGRHFIVMEYLEGETLNARMLRDGGRISVRDVVALGRQIASALGAAHGKAVVHRDLKPENVMLVKEHGHPDGVRVKILDFGQAKLTDRAGLKSDVIMGTPHYMSPEQCRSAKAATDKSDVYSLGVMLFEALAGRLPFTVDGAGELISMHLFSEPPRLADLALDVPKPLTALVDLMLSKLPEKRPAMTQVFDSLTAILELIPKGSGRAFRHKSDTELRIPVAIQQEETQRQTLPAVPTPTPPPSTAPYLAPPELRRLFEHYLRKDGELEAFVHKHYPQVQRRFVAGMDRPAKVQLLIDSIDRHQIAAELRQLLPGAFTHLLSIESGDEVGRLYPLRFPGRWLIGRGLDADIHLHEKDVSRLHAILDMATPQIVLQREGRNPFLVNGQAVETHCPLGTDDRIKMGRTVFRLETTFARDPKAVPKNWQDRTSSEPYRNTLRLVWMISDKALASGHVDSAERLMSPRLKELGARADAGEIPKKSDISDIFQRVLRLAALTKKDHWFCWIFDFARVCNASMDSPFLADLQTQLTICRPAIREAVSAYAETLENDALKERIKGLYALCRDAKGSGAAGA